VLRTVLFGFDLGGDAHRVDALAADGRRTKRLAELHAPLSRPLVRLAFWTRFGRQKVALAPNSSTI